MDEHEKDDDERDVAESDSGEAVGARGGDESSSADRLPPAPADDDTPLGDTDQHSRVSSDRNA